MNEVGGAASSTTLARRLPAFARALALAGASALVATPAAAEKKADRPAEADPQGGASVVRKRGPESRFGDVEVFGRVAVRAELERHESVPVDRDDPSVTERVDSFDLTVPLARIGVHYRAPVKWLSAQVEIDAAEETLLLDGWAMARNENFWARAGKFKMPFSAIEMDSSFTLPMVRRGVVHDLLVDELEVAGRRPGVALGARSKDEFRPSLVLGAFQGSILTHEEPGDRDVELASERALDVQSLVARAEARVWDVTLGVNYEHRVGTALEDVPRHYWTFGADAVLDTELGEHGLRAWLEVMDGSSFFEHSLKPSDSFDAVFVSVRAIAAFRFGGTRRETFYVEPYGMIATLDPDIDIASDVVVEEAFGVNVGLWKRARIGLELEFQKAQTNFPERYLLGENGDRKALVLGAQLSF
ncbi:MAG TPA: hypothetical protein VFZ53_02090 [Polyangiaceae bacterium]